MNITSNNRKSLRGPCLYIATIYSRNLAALAVYFLGFLVSLARRFFSVLRNFSTIFLSFPPGLKRFVFWLASSFVRPLREFAMFTEFLSKL